MRREAGRDPIDPQLAVDHGHRVTSHLRRHVWWPIGHRGVAHEAFHPGGVEGPGIDSHVAQWREGAGIAERTTEVDASDRRFHIFQDATTCWLRCTELQAALRFGALTRLLRLFGKAAGQREHRPAVSGGPAGLGASAPGNSTRQNSRSGDVSAESDFQLQRGCIAGVARRDRLAVTPKCIRTRHDPADSVTGHRAGA